MTLQPRWLDPEDTARYISAQRREVTRLVREGKLPAPSLHLGPRQPRWDRTKIDALFDPGQAQSSEAVLDAAVQAIRAQNARR